MKPDEPPAVSYEERPQSPSTLPSTSTINDKRGVDNVKSYPSIGESSTSENT